MVTRMTTVLDAPPARPPASRRPNGRIPPPPPKTGDDGGDDRGPEPRRPVLDNARLATMFLMAGETMLFAGLISAFLVLRLAAPVWPPPLQPRLPIGVTGVNTLVLLVSSVYMMAAVRALRSGRAPLATSRLLGAAALGALFLAVQGYEWVQLIGFGLTASSGAYGGTFYTLIGAHALHVVGALAWLALTLARLRQGRIRAERPAALRACAMYWHFVVGLWPILYVAVYLL